MSNPSDKELDHLSREAAGRFEPDESISSWEKLEQLLDKDDKDRRTPLWLFYNRRPVIYGLLLLSIGLLSYFLLSAPNGTNKSVQKGLPNPVEAAKSNPVQPQAGELSSDSKTSQPNKAIEPATRKSANPDVQATIKPAADRTIVAGDIPNKTLQPVNSAGEPGITKKPKSKSIDTDDLVSTSIGSRYSSGGNGSSAGQEKTANGNKHSKGVNQSVAAGGSLYATGSETKASSRDLVMANPGPLQDVLDNKPIIVDDRSLRNTPISHQPTTTPATAKKDSRPLHLHNPLHLGVMVAPDYTTVKSASGDKLSSNIGLSVGYQFFDHWSLNTGLTYTVKNYTAKAADFNGNTMWGLSYVDGNCHMIEIPLTIRYDFTSHSKTTFFLNGGLSSYLMRKESYDYYYTGVTDPYKKSYTTNESYWMAEASFSFGVEHRINKNFSVQVEPFVRAPLSGVGYGNIYLSSYGVAFSLRYSPWFRSKAKTGH